MVYLFQGLLSLTIDPRKNDLNDTVKHILFQIISERKERNERYLKKYVFPFVFATLELSISLKPID